MAQPCVIYLTTANRAYVFLLVSISRRNRIFQESIKQLTFYRQNSVRHKKTTEQGKSRDLKLLAVQIKSHFPTKAQSKSLLDTDKATINLDLPQGIHSLFAGAITTHAKTYTHDRRINALLNLYVERALFTFGHACT